MATAPELETFVSSVQRPPDFDPFWEQVLEELEDVPLDPELTPDPLRSTPVEAQGKCPPKCQGKMSSRWIAMLADYDTSDVARAMGGLSAFMYFLTVSLCMPSSRAIPRMDSPLRFAFCTAFHLAV